VRNHNRLLWNFDGALGGKTGYTFAAQKCFVGAVQRNGTTLIVAILGARDQWGDTKRLLEYGFDNLDSLKAPPAPAGKSTSSEQQVGVRGDRLSVLALPAAEKEPAASTDGFILQFGSFRERARAELLSKQINEQGFDAFVETTVVKPSETAYRVRLGPYRELLAAQETAQAILTKSGYRAMILPVQSALANRDDPS